MNEMLLKESQAKQNALNEMVSRQDAEKSEVLQLHEKMKGENDKRKRENEDLRKLIEAQKKLIDLANENLNQEILRKDREILRLKQDLSAQREQVALDGNILGRLERSVSTLKVNLNANVYFNAIR